ncbi:phosphoribosylanthranilate isomerase [Arthrobacter sp. TMP15]|uniref:phosphoribosylanthranilate isomerase n=1 Tax=Arthrobacter sp. TMP15 TaxID=3140789 RepID=UPI0031BACF21
MSALYIKICGLQTPETVAAAVDTGANAIGFIFAPGSPRTITAALAAELGRGVETVCGVETVGVFRNQPIDEVLRTAQGAAVTTVQLHGDESLKDMHRLREEGFRTLRAFSAHAYSSLSPSERQLWESERVLLDAVEPGAGVSFDTNMLANGVPPGFWLLAGGLTPANVAGYANALRPSGVDVSSGVESSRGVKDAGLIREFIEAARAA